MSRCHALEARPAALIALQQYGSSGSGSDSDADMEVDVERLAEKRRSRSPGVGAAAPPAKRRQPPLPLPDAVQQMFGPAERHEDRPEEHGGRMRGFAHVRGNWSTYVFIPYDASPVFHSLVQTCVTICEPFVRLTVQEEFHVSLTRTVVLKHHWMQSFMASVRQALESYGSFQLALGPARVYVNDEGTRTFLGLTVSAGGVAVAGVSRRLDRCLAEYGLPPFYQEGSFHLSIAWCTGDHSAAFQRLLPELDMAVAGYASQTRLSCDVTEVHCRYGNRRFEVPLGG
ncbi:U6 snRNA phosphodiesterase-like [Pollicipes pollicipes]|uniref:U6 snRNA phosphodiesterase-like n=1 Tax=Pollicipes pollicipes TaxID=41117 RepID=UPI001884D412|nr:U6 snRNA phosphodiesterase-like [Pollicipes pollicipes]XP_037094846.1 U6 snRNA phosphodiesterase-like [Pollicipes pollicipes]XP_037094847.1 U6 snRNA phosphodiesterase-like [Pollicipes pollicipes]